MESENSMQRNIKKEGEGFRDIVNEAVNQGQRLDDEQFKTHILKTIEVKLEQKFPGCGIKDIPSEFEEKLPLPDKPRIIVDNPDQSTKLVESQEVGPSTAAASSKSRPLPCLCAGRDCWGT